MHLSKKLLLPWVISGALTIIPIASVAQAATEAQQKICVATQSKLILAECNTLAEEFDQRWAVTSAAKLPLKGLNAPMSNSAFSEALQQEAYLSVLRKVAIQQVKSTSEQALITAAQLIATKAAINQTGATNSATASTNLVTKPTTTSLISLAAESGAFTDTENGTTLNAQANLDGLQRYLRGKPFVDSRPTLVDNLRHITLGATFNIAQSSSTGVATSGTATAATPSIASILVPANNVSFNSLSVNYSIYRRYDPHSSDFVARWETELTSAQDKVKAAAIAIATSSNALTAMVQSVGTDPKVDAALKQWAAEANAVESASSPDFAQLVAAYQPYVELYATTLLTKANAPQAIVAQNAALNTLEKVDEDILDAARGTPLVTLNYTYATPANKPATHTGTLVASYLFGNTKKMKKENKTSFWDGTQFNANIAGTWFATVPTGATYGSLQSFQFSTELDVPVGPLASPRAVFSVAGYGQYQYTATVLNITAGNLVPGTNITLPSDAQVLLGTPGWLEVAQAKLVFNIGKGASVPVAFKWSSKTDLVQQGDWKGQFGLTYDLTALTNLLMGKASTN